MDLGSSPDKKFSTNFQAGSLSFEFIYKNQKIICNSGYFQKHNHQLNQISKSSAPLGTRCHHEEEKKKKKKKKHYINKLPINCISGHYVIFKK